MSRLDDFKYAMPLRRLNKVVQIVLTLTLLVGLNTFAARYYLRQDISRRGVYSLSPETLAYLKALREPVKIIATIPGDEGDSEASRQQNLLHRYVENLLTEYSEAAKNGSQPMIQIEFVDPFRNPRRADELARTYHIEQNNVVIFASSKRQRVVTPSEILEFRDMKPVAFKGEQAFTSAILETSSEKTPVVYFTTGHAEMALDSVAPNRGLSLVAQELKARNLEPRPLDLSKSGVPDDADMIVVVDPQGQFLPQEVERLRAYLDGKDGRLVMFLGAGKTSGLENFLLRWGIHVDDMIVEEVSPDDLDSSGGILVRTFADHPITSILHRNSAPIVAGAARPIGAGKTALEPGTRLFTLMASSSTSWADRGWRTEKEPMLNPEMDIQGPIPLAVLAQTGTTSADGITVPGSRILAVGLGDAIANNRITAFGNQAFFFSMTNWMLDREQVIAIAPLPIDRYQLPLSRENLGKLAYLLCIPAAAMILAGLVAGLLRRY
jgi:ABC-type uncharacterized transport system involved in gliding motility auxiliary subunit